MSFCFLPDERATSLPCLKIYENEHVEKYLKRIEKLTKIENVGFRAQMSAEAENDQLEGRRSTLGPRKCDRDTDDFQSIAGLGVFKPQSRTGLNLSEKAVQQVLSPKHGL